MRASVAILLLGAIVSVFALPINNEEQRGLVHLECIGIADCNPVSVKDNNSHSNWNNKEEERDLVDAKCIGIANCNPVDVEGNNNGSSRDNGGGDEPSTTSTPELPTGGIPSLPSETPYEPTKPTKPSEGCKA